MRLKEKSNCVYQDFTITYKDKIIKAYDANKGSGGQFLNLCLRFREEGV